MSSEANSLFILETCIFLVCFCYFWKVKFAYFKLIYFRISKQNYSKERGEVGIFSKAPDWKPLFLLKIKHKQNPGCRNKQYRFQFLNTFIRISGPILEVKKLPLINDYENIIAYGKSKSKGRCRRTSEVCSKYINTFGGLKVGGTPGKFGYFYSRLSLKTIFLALKLTQNVNNNISFS